MKRIYTILVAVLITASVFAQAPEKMSYQAVVRNSSDMLVTNMQVGIQISILQGSVSGPIVYTETQTPTTNANGLLSIEIGVVPDFDLIDWANDIYFIKTETDPTGGINYTITGTNQLMSVPYALHAKTAETLTGTINYTETDPIFGTSVANGITAVDTANWNNHTVDTDTHIDSAGISSLGFVAEKTYTIGLWPELGGYVFRVSADGKHGLVAETQDQGISLWYEAQDIISSPSTHSTNGAKFCDWRMPTKYELNEISIQRVAIGGFANNSYWSSTEVDSGDAWYQDFRNGTQGTIGKYIGLYVRSVRAF